jgi:hypothetical protein
VQYQSPSQNGQKIMLGLTSLNITLNANVAVGTICIFTPQPNPTFKRTHCRRASATGNFRSRPPSARRLT